MPRLLRALLIDDSEDDTFFILRHLRRNGFEVTWERVDTAEALQTALAKECWDLALCDYVMPRLSGQEALAILRSQAPDLPVITVSGNVGEEYAVEVMRAGSRDYVRKDELSRLVPAIERELAESTRVQERRVLEAALDRSEAEFRAMFEQAPLGIALVDPASGRIQDVNHRFAAILGRTREELRSVLWAGITHPDDVAEGARNVARMNAGEIHGFTMEKRYLRSDGSCVWCQTTVAPMSGASGTGVRHLCMIEDVSERREDRARLREQADLLDLAHDAIIVSDLDRRVRFWSRGAMQTYGWTSSEATGRVARDLLETEFPEPLSEIEARLQERGEWEGELTHVHKNGRKVTVDSRWVLQRDPAGSPVAILEINRDVTANVQTREALARASALLAEGQALAHLGSWEYFVETGKTYWSAEEFRIYGLPPAGESPSYPELLSNFFDPGEAASVNESFEQAQRDRTGWEREHRITRPDGNVRILQDVATPHFDAAGRLIRYTGATLDVTERRAAEATLSDVEERFRAFMEQSPTIAWIKDEEGRHVYLSPTYERRFGVQLADWRDKTDAELWPPETADTFRKHDLSVLAGQQAVLVTEETRDPDGSISYWLNSRFPLRDSSGRQFVAGVGIDVTELKRAEDALRASEAKFRAYVENAPIAMMVTDLEGVIVDRNPAAIALHGAAATAPGKKAWDLLLPVGVVRFAEKSDLIQRGCSVVETVQMRHEDGTVFWGSLSLRRLNSEHLTGFCVDVTKQVEAEITMREASAILEAQVEERTASLEAANRELDAFNYSVSHDLRAPLRHIEGFAEVLEDEYGRQLPAEGQRCVQMIRESGRRMAGMLEALMRLSRSGRSAVEWRKIRPAKLVEAAWTARLHGAAERRVELVLRDLPEVMGDAALLREVFENLLDNAVKFTRTASAPRIEVGVERHDGRDAFYVRDNGVGFDAQHADKLFVPFRRLHDEQEFEGTGIGLSIVKRIVERHGGQVWAESAPAQGATFYFTLGR